MSIRTDTLNANLTRFLGRYSPPRGMSDQGITDETAALLRALDRAAPGSGYDDWWRRFEDALSEGMTTRAWPTVGDVAKAAKYVPVPRAAKSDDDDDWLERGLQKRLRHWLDGCPGDGGKGIPAHLVTMDRLNAIGVYGEAAQAAIAFAANPYNHGIDKGLTHDQRERHARMWPA